MCHVVASYVYAGVRSVSFNDCIITIGTGYGSLLFYDIRMNRLLQNTDGTTLQQRTGTGWLVSWIVAQAMKLFVKDF